jgi:hypothetical protein
MPTRNVTYYLWMFSLDVSYGREITDILALRGLISFITETQQRSCKIGRMRY